MKEMTQSIRVGNKGFVRAEALLDTGATASLVNSKIARETEMEPVGSESIVDASGTTTDCAVVGGFLVVYKKKYPMIFMVYDSSSPVIIGQDFFQRYAHSINFKDDKVKIK